MSKKTNRVCKVCEEKYYYCPSCSPISAADKYKVMFCSENCRDIFGVLSRHNVGQLNKNEAKEALSALDLSKRNQFVDNIKSDVDEIMKSNKKFKKKAQIDEEQVVADVIVTVVEEVPVVEAQEDVAITEV